MVRREPSGYLSLAPQLFRLMTTSSNNWMLIKLIKLVGSCNISQTLLTKPSLLYECVHTCIVGGMLRHTSGDSLAELCVTKLAAFLQDSDQNCKRNLAQSFPILKNCISSEVHRAFGARQNSSHTSQSSSTIPRHDIVQYQRPGS